MRLTFGDIDRVGAESLPSDAEWATLASCERRRLRLQEDLFFRESWADAESILGDRAADSIGQVALLNLKPDAVVGRRGRQVLEFLASNGFSPVFAARVQLCRHSIRELWRDDWIVYPVDRLAFSTLWYTSCDILLLIVRDERDSFKFRGAERLAGLKGSAFPELRRPEELRSLLHPPNRVFNFVHVADTAAEVVREIGIFLDRSQRRALFRALPQERGAHETAKALDIIQALEHDTSAHDLDAHAALERLFSAGALPQAVVQSLRGLLARCEQLGWQELCDLLPLPQPGPLRWDFIVLASHLIPLDRESGRICDRRVPVKSSP